MNKKFNFLKLLEGLAFTLVITLVSIMFVQVFARQFLDKIPVWSGEEVSTLLLIWIVNIGAGIATATDSHLNMDYFFEKIPEVIRSYLQIIVYGVICVFLIGIAVISIDLAWSGRDAYTARLDISMFWFQSSIFIGMVIMFYYYAKQLLQSIKDVITKRKLT